MLDRDLAPPATHAARRFRPQADLPFGHVPRPDLVDVIAKPYVASLTLIVAEPGSGKTTLAIEWATQASMPVGWIVLDGTITDEAAFAAAIGRALLAATSTNRDPLVPAAHGPPMDRDSLIAAIRNLDRDVCIVIDNCEVMRQGIALIKAVLEIPDSCLRLILIGRSVPNLRLARLRSQGRVREVDAGALRLRSTEAEVVLRSIMPFDLSPQEVARIIDRAEGWVSAVVLQAHGMRAGEGGGGGETPSERRDFLDEYVEQELLAPLTADLRELALSTCWLPILNAAVCDAQLERSGSDRALARLAGAFPFLRKVGSDGGYRYHPMVRARLKHISRTTVSADVVTAWGGRAAAWMLGAGELEAAASIALDTGATDVESLVSPWFRHLAERSDFEQLGRWVDRLPKALVNASLDLAWWQLVARIGTGHVFAAAALVDAHQRRASSARDSLAHGRVLLARGWLASIAGRDTEARGHLAGAIERLPADAVAERMYASSLLGEEAFRNGRDFDAAAALKRAEHCAARLPLDERWSWVKIGPGRANGYALRGDLHSAISKYRLMLAEIPPYLEDAGIDGLLRSRLVSLYVERNDLGAARREYDHIEALLEPEPRAWHRDAMLARARLLLAEGRRDEAEEWASDHLKSLRRLPEKTQMVHLLARIWLERGEYPLVESWLADVADLENPWIRTFGQINHRALAINLDLLQGRFDEAAHLAERLTSEATAMQRWSEAISLSARWAVALHALDQQERADDVLRGVLARGVRGGFVRAFHVPGFDTGAIFASVWSEQESWQVARRRLTLVLGQARRGEQATVSPRELEVLRLVAEGRTNRQIGASMFISANTVRNHLVRIGERLEAGNRLEAVARARDLGLLS